MRSIASLTLMLAALVASTSSTVAEEPKGDLARLQGTWTAKFGPNQDIPLVISIKENTTELTWFEGLQEVKVKGELRVDDKANPKTIDWVKFTGPSGQVEPDNLSIYKLEGETWTVCSGGASNPRPSKFEAAGEGFPRLFVLGRVKDPAAEKPIQGDLAKFQGTWLAPAGPNDEVVVTMTVKVNAYTAKWDRGDGTNVELRGEIRVNEKATPRKTIDFFKNERNDGDDARDNLGVYEFDGEKIKVCLGGSGNERPAEFKKGNDGSPLLLVFSKKKD